ncbi:MAG: hypothetical protein H0T53_01700 [Herpetosiphonaceae bacterium]|nr:hypothetical protein [Herpetosiphonaceae bacterium]
MNVYLLCFVQHRTRRLHDHLLSGFMREVKTIQDDAKTIAQEQVAAYRLQRTRDLARAGRVLQLFTADDIPPETTFDQVQSRAFAVLNRDRLDSVARYMD